MINLVQPISVTVLAVSAAPNLTSACLFALMLIAAIVGAVIARWIKVPKVVGYLAGGITLHILIDRFPFAGVTIGDASNLSVIKSLALGLIMFSIGQVFEARHLRTVGRRVVRLSLSEILCVVILVGAGCGIVAWLGGFGQSGEAAAFAMLLAVVAVATAPAATLFVLDEYDAKGPTTDTMLTMTALNNVASILLFYSAFSIFASLGWVERLSSQGHGVVFELVAMSLGSAAIGVLIGVGCSVAYVKMNSREFVMLLLATFLLIAVLNQFVMAATGISLNYLLICLFLGATFANVASDQDTLNQTLSIVGAPIYAAFFVLAGFELHLGELSALGLIGAVYAVMRTAGKALGGYLGSRWINNPTEIRPYLGLGLLCQAGVAIGLADYASAHWVVDGPDGMATHDLALRLKTVVLGSVVLFEIAGPLALKKVAVSGGEVKAITLLRRHRQPVSNRTSAWLSVYQAATRAIRVGFQSAAPQDKLTVRHIMRTNIKLLQSASSFDDVLGFVESSRFNDFPVVNAQNEYVGMIRFADLRDILYDPALRDLVTADDLVAADVPTVNPDVRLETLFVKFASVDIGSLPVVESKESRRVIGVVEQRDLLRALHTSDGRRS